jgi:hypothetical protein
VKANVDIPALELMDVDGAAARLRFRTAKTHSGHGPRAPAATQ